MSRIDGFLSADQTIAAYQEILQRELLGARWWYAYSLAKMGAEVHRLLVRSQQLGAIPDVVDLEAVNVAFPPLRDALESL